VIGFRVHHQAAGSPARTATLTLPHGEVATPAFMPVATHGSLKGLVPGAIRETGTGMILSNAYHLWLRPGSARIARLGGLHRFMGWDGPILTDSGGYQIFSLGPLVRVTDAGVRFRSYLDGSEHFLTPEDVVGIQEELGSDVAMVLDECPAGDASREVAEAAMHRTTDWARRAAAARRRDDQAVFGIVQGGTDPALRAASVAALRAMDFDGYAIGGLSVGEPRPETRAVAAATAAQLPHDRPRYFMGAGTPTDLVDLAATGIDLFDCVLPTRHARNGTLFTSGGTVAIRNACYRDDPRPLDPECSCPTCAQFSRAYLRHLAMAREPLAVTLNTMHNVTYYQRLMQRIREAIASDDLAAVRVAVAAPPVTAEEGAPCQA
jgi:queuine tRNA-ribosyltransferase